MTGSLEYMQWFVYSFWLFVFVQDVVEKVARTFMEFPLLQKPASFNLEAVKEQVRAAALSHPAAR